MTIKEQIAEVDAAIIAESEKLKNAEIRLEDAMAFDGDVAKVRKEATVIRSTLEAAEMRKRGLQRRYVIEERDRLREAVAEAEANKTITQSAFNSAQARYNAAEAEIVEAGDAAHRTKVQSELEYMRWSTRTRVLAAFEAAHVDEIALGEQLVGAA
jgi:hypothetical protein